MDKPITMQIIAGTRDLASNRLAPAKQVSQDGFDAAFRKALAGVNADMQRADMLQREFQLGKPGSGIEETMLASQKASISFQALVQVRNRLVSAYQDIMNMPL